jgi:tRNA threonylcarbamoyladenosine biosynthesis protein TsaB
MIICLETATDLCSVALCDNSGVVSLRENSNSKSHASNLTVFIDDLLNEAGIKPSDLEAVAVSKGPGSYTGLRIGVSAAKGIAYGASIPLIGIETTLSMLWGLTGGKSDQSACNVLYCPMLDARRMEVYYAIYDCHGNAVTGIAASVMDENSFNDIPGRIIFFGNGASKLKGVIKKEDVGFRDDFRMSAAHMLKPAMDALAEKKFENVAYFEPLYLKDFIATTQKKNILG